MPDCAPCTISNAAAQRDAEAAREFDMKPPDIPEIAPAVTEYQGTLYCRSCLVSSAVPAQPSHQYTQAGQEDPGITGQGT